MNQRPKCETYNYRTGRNKHERRSLWSWLRQRFLRQDFKSTIHKRKIDKLDFIKIKNYSLKDTIKGVQRQAKDGEKIFLSHISDKALKSRIYKELSKFNIKKTNNSI